MLAATEPHKSVLAKGQGQVQWLFVVQIRFGDSLRWNHCTAAAPSGTVWWVGGSLTSPSPPKTPQR